MKIRSGTADFGTENFHAEFQWTVPRVAVSEHPNCGLSENMASKRRKSDNLVLQWIECDNCQTVLEFPNQPHFCEGRLVHLDIRLLDLYPDCPRCFCVLTYPTQRHRCPDEMEPRDLNICDTNSDWFTCEHCACVLAYPRQQHICTEDRTIVDATDSPLFVDNRNRHLKRMRI